MKVLRIFGPKQYNYDPILIPVNQIKWVLRGQETLYPINYQDPYNSVRVVLIDGEEILGYFPEDESITQVLEW